MRNSIIAIVLAAAIAGVIALLTGPIAAAKYEKSPPAAKADRLDLRPESCLRASEWPYYGNDCIRKRGTSPRRQVRVVADAGGRRELSPLSLMTAGVA